MSGFAGVSIQDKTSGCNAKVGRDGAVRQSPGVGDTTNVGFVATTASATLLQANENRRQVQIQNQSADTPVMIRLDDGTGTGAPYRVDPGATYSFPPGVTWRGEIQAETLDGTADVAVIEFSEPAEDADDSEG